MREKFSGEEEKCMHPIYVTTQKTNSFKVVHALDKTHQTMCIVVGCPMALQYAQISGFFEFVQQIRNYKFC